MQCQLLLQSHPLVSGAYFFPYFGNALFLHTKLPFSSFSLATVILALKVVGFNIGATLTFMSCRAYSRFCGKVASWFDFHIFTSRNIFQAKYL